MRRLWTESGARHARWWRPRWPPMPRPRWLVVCPQIDQVDELIDDLALFTRLKPERFPASESFDRAAHDEVFGERLHLLKVLQAAGAPKLVVTSIQSLLQPVPSRETLARQTRTLRVGDAWPSASLAKWLVENGFFNTPAVELPGEFSVRGGIVDIFAPDWDGPVRVEFFGDEIESIRRFEISSQRSLESLDGGRRDDYRAGRRRPGPPGRLLAAAKLVPAAGADGVGAAGAAVFGTGRGADSCRRPAKRRHRDRRPATAVAGTLAARSPGTAVPGRLTVHCVEVSHGLRRAAAGVPVPFRDRLGRGRRVRWKRPAG